MWNLNASSVKGVSVKLITPQVTIVESCGDYGNILAGDVSWDIASSTHIKSIEVEVSGRYRAEWVEGVGPSRMQHCVDKPIFQETQTLAPFQPATSVTGHMPAAPAYQLEKSATDALMAHGRYCLPFQLQLPDWLPPSIATHVGQIEYAVVARIKSAARYNSVVSSDKQPLTIVRQLAKSDELERAAVYWHKLESTGRVGVLVNSRTASVGDNLLVGLQFDNIDRRTFSSIDASAKLVETILYKSPCGHRSKSVTRTVGSFNDILGADQLSVEKLRLTIPNSTRVDCQSAHVSVRHALQVSLKMCEHGKQQAVTGEFTADIQVLPNPSSLALPSYTSVNHDMLM
ncbi:hypothetical protein EC988_002208 [Linderina pennispora]|nr:hypothetical protein EC988_002208 [Linderina pennispora]